MYGHSNTSLGGGDEKRLPTGVVAPSATRVRPGASAASCPRGSEGQRARVVECHPCHSAPTYALPSKPSHGWSCGRYFWSGVSVKVNGSFLGAVLRVKQRALFAMHEEIENEDDETQAIFAGVFTTMALRAAHISVPCIWAPESKDILPLWTSPAPAEQGRSPAIASA